MTEKLTPERAVRLLRAKAGELENHVLTADESWKDIASGLVIGLAADIALIATLLADHIERSPGPWGPEDEDWGRPDPDDDVSPGAR